MPETLEPKVKETLRAYVREVKTLPNEAAKRSRFSAVIAELFPGSKAVSDFSRGIEKQIQLDSRKRAIQRWTRNKTETRKGSNGRPCSMRPRRPTID